MAATPKPIRKAASKFGAKIKESLKKHPKATELHKTSKHLKKVRGFNESEKKRVLKEK
jgi:hypothetical protein